MSGDDKRTRFTAVVEEMFPTEPTPPKVDKMDYIFVENGCAQPCPKCGASAFTRIDENFVMRCRGCPPPAPMYRIAHANGTPLAQRDYKCSQCGKREPVTLTIDQVNLYCGGCRQLSLHDLIPQKTRPVSAAWMNPIVPVEFVSFDEAWRALEYVKNGTGKLPWPSLRNPTSVISVDEARAGQKIAREAADEIQRRNKNAGRVQELVEGYRAAIGLVPFVEFAEKQRSWNRENIGTRDVERRTGRTTRGLLEAIARVMVAGVETLYVRSGIELHDEYLIRATWQLYYAAGLELTKPLTNVKRSSPANWRGVQDPIEYVDHVASEF